MRQTPSDNRSHEPPGGPDVPTISEHRPLREVRARFDERSITVYQAYSPAIAGPAAVAGTFVSPFKRERMTWIKPSFLWMMYRCGWATKPGQERVLAVTISREGFEQALCESCLSHFEAGTYPSHEAWEARKRASPVRVQWDPERDVHLNPLPWRSLQVGLSGSAVHRYVDEWIVGIEDVTPLVADLRALLGSDPGQVAGKLPAERPYPLPDDVAAIVGATRA